MSGVVEVRRGTLVESRHRFRAAVVDAGGRLHARCGDPGLVTYARSAVKPIQALPLVTDGVADRFRFTALYLALCCGSHNGEPWQVDAVATMLTRIDATADALACGPHSPIHDPSARALVAAGREPAALHNNCSGKHAGMLALARAHAWPLEGYRHLGHPVQQRMLAELAVWSDVPEDEIPTGVDGCGVVTFALPVHALARAFARFGAAAVAGRAGPARIVAAMGEAPDGVAGTDRLCTDLIRATGGRIVAKVGAEGVYCAMAPAEGLGIAVKVEDGARRAVEPALLAVLRELGLLPEREAHALTGYAEPAVRNTRGERVGEIRARCALEVPA